MSEQFEISATTGVHAWLSRLAGAWEGSTKTWFEPDQLVDESPVRGTIRPILGGRFMLHEYKGSLDGKPFEGVAIYGYSMESGKFQSAWADSFHNGTSIMFSEGAGDDRLTVLGGYDYPAADGVQRWGWRTEISIISPDEIMITAYNITPDGLESKGTETLYHRRG